MTDFKHNVGNTNKRVFRGRRRTFRVKRRKTMGSSAMAKATLALRKVNAMERKQETNFLYALQQNLAPSTLAITQNMAFIAQGDDEQSRVGNKVTITGIGFRVNIVHNPNTEQALLRIIMAVDKRQENLTIPNMSAILHQQVPNSYLRTDQAGRFRILYDRTVALDSNKNPRYVFNVWASGLKINMMFNGSLGSDTIKNGIYVFLITDRAIVDAPLFQWTRKVQFEDA